MKVYLVRFEPAQQPARYPDGPEDQVTDRTAPTPTSHDEGYTEDVNETNCSLPVRPDPRQLAYDAVHEYIRGLGPFLPSDQVHRNAIIWQAVHAALETTHIGRCVSSHCVEGDHMVLVEEPSEPAPGDAAPLLRAAEIRDALDPVELTEEDADKAAHADEVAQWLRHCYNKLILDERRAGAPQDVIEELIALRRRATARFEEANLR
ncbi:hypothetical protein ACFWPV_09750 [Streptomyces uncialis]|uniref:hypothetical protein n=1 Tax=Streptomyces uncialis TaxID=1048205 RepID=UPI00366328DD